MLSAISSFILRLMGWKVVIPYDLKDFPKKFVFIAIPHTSNWDFPLGLLVRSAINKDIKFVGKDSLFRWPLGGIFRWLGGYPVDRSRRTNFVDAVVDIFPEKEEFAICIAPEGTRKKVDRLKTGFYYIALGAGVPIIMGTLDYGRKQVAFSEPFHPTGNVEADFVVIRDHYRGVYGKIAENSFMYGEKANS